MKIDEEKEYSPNEPRLKAGDVFRAEWHDIANYFMVVRLCWNGQDCYLAVQLDGDDQGKLTADGDETFYEGVGTVWSNTEMLLQSLEEIGFEHFEKVELEATAKHEYNL